MTASDPGADGSAATVGTPEGRRVVELLWNPPAPRWAAARGREPALLRWWMPR